MEVKLVRTEADIDSLNAGDQFTFDDGERNNNLQGPINLLEREAEWLRLRELIDQKFSRVLVKPQEPAVLPPRSIEDDLDDERTFAQMGGTSFESAPRRPRRTRR